MSTLENLREAAMILRDPHSRDPEPVHALAAELERIATLAEEYEIRSMLGILAREEGIYPQTVRGEQEHQLRNVATRALEAFLNQAGFARDGARKA